jgi:hypothetical protein
MSADRTGYPRPPGTDRTGDPLLTMTDESRTAVMMIVHLGWRLTGYAQSPSGRALADRRHHPRPGDLVLVPDAIRRIDPGEAGYGWGYLIEERQEPVYDDATWERIQYQFDGGPTPTERIFYVQYGPNPQDVYRWENVSCMTVPHNRAIAAEIDAAAIAIVNAERT